MGGHGSGGQRVGSGRKSKDAKARWLTSKGAERPANVPEGGAVSLEDVPMPAGLADSVAAVWVDLAPLALQAKTLTPATSGAMLDLCKAIVLRDKFAEQIDEDGYTFQKVTVDGSGQEHSETKAHPLIAQHRGMMQRVEAGRARFRLAPIGKEIATSGQEKPTSALERLQAQTKLRAVK